MSLLKLYNVYINSRRTSVRLEPLFWNYLNKMAKDNNISVSGICTNVYNKLEKGTLTANLRTCILAYSLHHDIEQALQFKEFIDPSFINFQKKRSKNKKITKV